MTADVDHRVNDWWICDRGRFDYPGMDAAQGSLVRRQGEQVPVSVGEAEARALELLSEAGERAAVLVGSCASNEELAALRALQDCLREDLGCFPCDESELAFLAALRESGLEIGSLEELAKFDRAVVLGEDPELSHPLLALRLGQATQRSGLSVTLVHDGDFASPGDFTRRWRRVESAPGDWLREENAELLSGDDALLIAFSDSVLCGGQVDPEMIRGWMQRRGETRLLHLAEGMNRRGLLEAAAAAGERRDLIASLEAGEVDTLLVFGIDPRVDFAGRQERWERAIGRANRLVIQSARMGAFHAGAELLLTRRRAVDLSGSMSNCWGLTRPLDSWQPVAGMRRSDTDWFAPLIAARSSAKLTPAGGHDR